MEKIINEIWKPCVGYEDLYEVSNLGRVKSLNYRRTGREQLLKPTLRGRKGDQYFIVTLYKNGVGKTFGVHVIVALSFSEICGEPFEGAQCNHIDENHTNNTPENLNWLSVQDNINHGTRNERVAKALSKTVYQYTKSYELVKEWQSTQEVARQTGWSHANISLCCNGKLKSAHGFIWSYTLL